MAGGPVAAREQAGTLLRQGYGAAGAYSPSKTSKFAIPIFQHSSEVLDKDSV